jgi:hypothetical protein
MYSFWRDDSRVNRCSFAGTSFAGYDCVEACKCIALEGQLNGDVLPSGKQKTKNNRSRLEATDRLAITEKRNSLYYSHMLFTHSFAEPTKTQTLHPLKPHVEHHKLSTKRSTTLANPMVSPKNLCATGLGGHVLFPSSTQFFGIIQKLASRTSSHDSHRSAVGLHWRRFRTLSF